MSRQREDRLTFYVAQHLPLRLPSDVAWTHFPAGESRPARTGAKLNRMGLKPGWPDFQFVWRGRFHGIELKLPKDHMGGKTYQRPAQKAAQAEIEAAGGLYAVCRTFDEVIGTLRGWGLPLRDEFGRAA